MKLRIFLIFAGVLMLAASCNYNGITSNNNQSGTSNANQASNSDVFLDETNKISLDYSGLSVSKSPVGTYIAPQNNFPSNGSNLITLYLDKSKYTGTNVESAWANLSINKDLNQTNCYSATAGRTGVNYNQTRTVQNNNWHYSLPNPSGDAAAGHAIATETYRLYKNNTCYETVLGVSSFNRFNLEKPDSVKDYNQQELFSYLGAVFNKLMVR